MAIYVFLIHFHVCLMFYVICNTGAYIIVCMVLKGHYVKEQMHSRSVGYFSGKGVILIGKEPGKKCALQTMK